MMNQVRWRVARNVVCVALCFLGLVASAQAAPDAPLSEEEFFTDIPVVLSVSRLSQPVSEAPSAVTVIDRDTIRTSGVRDIADLFRFVPGFYVGSYLGHEPVISHGITGRVYGRVQVLVDGRSVYTPLFGQVPWSSLPVHLEDIERIEVTRGPNAASYGANSFFGVINIITRHAAEERGGAALVRAGDDGIADGMLRYGGRSGDLDYRLTLGYQADDGLANLHDFRRVSMLSGRGDYRINATDALQFQFGYSDGHQGQGWATAELNPPHTQHISNAFAQMRWQRVLGVDDEMAVQFYYTQTDSRERADTRAIGSVLPTTLSLNTTAERYDLEFQRNQGLGPSVRVVWGASARLDRVYAPLYLNTEAIFDTDLYRLFGNLEWRLTPSVIVNVGAMGEHNSVTGSELSPRGAINWHFAPGQTIRAGISEAARTPTVLENDGAYYLNLPVSGVGNVAFPYYFGPGNLKAEHLLSREIGYIGAWPEIGLDVDLRLYKEDFSDIIDVTRHTQLMLGVFQQRYYVYGNLGQAETEGAETQIGWHNTNSRVWFTHAYRRTNSGETSYVNATPDHIYSVLAAHRFPGKIEVSASFYHVDAMEPIGDGSYLTGHNRVDLRLAKQFRLGNADSEIALVGQNLVGSYYDYNDKNKIEQRVFMTLRTGF